MVGGVPFFSASSPASSAGRRVCELDQGSEDFFSPPRIPPAEKNDTERTPTIVEAKESATATLRTPLAADMEGILRKATRLYPQIQWMHCKEYSRAPSRVREMRGLFLEFEARAMELVGGGSQSFGNILVRSEALQVDGVENRKHVQADIERSLGIVDQITDDRIVFAEIAVVGDEPKDFIGEAGHGGKGFDFLIGEARRLEHGALDNFVVVADERTARFGATLHGELHALRDGHFREALNEGLPSGKVGFDRRCSFGKRRLINWSAWAVKFVELIFLIDGQRRGLFERGRQSGRFADAIKFFHQGLDSDGGKMPHHGNEIFSGAILVLHHGVAHAGLVR